MEYHIYKITNKNNNKIYIGITSKTVQHRFKNHIRKAKIGSTTNLHQSMMKHGEENFYVEELYTFSTEDKKFAYMIEQTFIDMYESVKKGYNMEIGFGWNIMDRRGKNNPMYGKESGNAKKVIVDGVVYKNMGICSEELGINRNTLTRRCNSEKFPNYKYC